MARPLDGLADGMIETVHGFGNAEIALNWVLEPAAIVAVKFSAEHYLPSAECRRER